MELVLEGGHNPKVSTPTAQGPEEVGVLVLTGREDLAVGRYHVSRYQVVAGQTVFPHEPADTASQREASYAGIVDRSSRCSQAVHLAFAIELTPENAALSVHPPLAWVDTNTFHGAEVDDKAAVAGRMA